jgi:HAD superfamily hydrolase (TIGR01509 family)
MDFAYLAGELGARGFSTSGDELERAEAAARPAISHAIQNSASTETREMFEYWVGLVLAGTRVGRTLDATAQTRLAREMAPLLRQPGQSHLLWRRVMPGADEALPLLRAAGYRMYVVSNSDGTAEKSLAQCGLREHLDAVFDSHHVGFEKPDPRFFAHALRESGADPARTLHVGDLYAADVVGARAAGIHALLLDPFGDWPPLDVERAPTLRALCQRVAARRAR